MRDYGKDIKINSRLCNTFDLAKDRETKCCRINYVSEIKNLMSSGNRVRGEL